MKEKVRDREKEVTCDWPHVLRHEVSEPKGARATERKNERLNVCSSVHLCECILRM